MHDDWRFLRDAAIEHDRALVLVLSVFYALLWHFWQPIVFTHDSPWYLDAARAIAGVNEGNGFVYFRAPLTPLLLAITGVPTLETFTWFVVAQLAIGVAAIVLFHDAARRINRPLGLVATLALISTCFAFVQSKSIMTEQLYMLGWILCIHGALRYLGAASAWPLAETVVGLLVLALTRAQGAYVAIVVLPVLAMSGRGRVLPVMLGFVVFGLVVYGSGLLESRMLREFQTPTRTATVTPWAITNSTGKMVFMVVYWDTFRYLGRAAVQPSNGPATQRLVTDLRGYYAVPTNLSANLGQEIADRFSGNPAALVAEILNAPSGRYWFAMWLALDEYLGAAKADWLLLRVTVEALAAHPLLVVETYLRNFAVSLVHADSRYVWKHPNFPEALADPLGPEIAAYGDSSKTTLLARVLNVWFPVCRNVALGLTILTAPFAFRSSWRTGWILLLLLVLYNNTTVALAATPESRYTAWAFPAYLLMLTIAGDRMWPPWRARELNVVPGE